MRYPPGPRWWAALTVGLALAATWIAPTGGAGNPLAPPHAGHPLLVGVTTRGASPVAEPSKVAAFVSPEALDLAWSTAYIFYGAGDPEGYLFGQGSVMAVDNAIQNTTSFGGEGVSGLSNITLVWNNGTVGYWAYANSTLAPSPRSNSSFQSYEPAGYAVLFGGLVSLASQATTNDTWRYWFVNQTWENVTQGTAPPARESAAFAVDPGAGIGLLEGGVNPDYQTGSSTGAVLWNDTWVVNLTTLAWSPLAVTNAPPPMYGSTMVWDPSLAEFVLFGGCNALGCTNNVWTIGLASTHWSRTTPGGTAPTGRGSSSFVWDPVDNVTLLFGGFTSGAGGPSALADTFALSANLATWTTLSSVDGPPPTYDAASAFSDYAGCVGMWVQGGSPAATAIEYNDYLLAPAFEPGLNCFSPIGGTNGPPPKCTNLSAIVTVQVLDARTGEGLSGAPVEIAGSCGASNGVSGPGGFLNLSDAAPDYLTIYASHPGYHSGQETATLTGQPGQVFSIRLVPFPTLHAHVLGRTAAGTFPLAGAVVAGGSIILGNTSAEGWMNGSAPSSLNGTLSVSATAVDYSMDLVNVSVPYTGDVYANLTLAAYGPIDIELVDALNGQALPGVGARLSFLGPLGANSTLFTTDARGWYNTSLKAGNYSVSESIPGYFTNQSAGAFYHDWVNATVVVLGAVPQYGADVDVQVLNRVLATPVPDATVAFGGLATLVDDPHGWANATNLGPPGFLTISASAPGFYPNTTTITIAPYAVVPVVLHLTPAPPCSAFAACPPPTASPPVFVGLSFLPGPGLARDLLLGAPAILVLVGALYVLFHRRDPPGRREGIPVGAAGEVYQRPPTPSPTPRGG